MAYDPTRHLIEDPGNRWQFRWRFEFASKPTKTGQWNGASRVEDSASMVNKEGLVRAIVEGKHWLTKEVRVFADCPGPDYVNFEHLAVRISNDQSVRHFVYGMRLRSRYWVASCFADGSTEVESWSADRNYLFPEWTKY